MASSLEAAGLSARAYHAGMESEARSTVQDWWMSSEQNIVVATIAFGMGIDKANVRYVYHYNLPKSLESYSQEIGRAGRDGAPSTVELLACAADVPVLENFAYGDTPAGSSLRSLVDDLLTLGPEFDVSQYEMSGKHDLRMLVLRTAMTYLELLGVLRQGTPFYNGYEIRPLLPVEQIVGKFQGEPATLVENLFNEAKRGRTWYALSPGDAAERLGQERRRVVKSLEYLEERGWVELRAADVRQRYTRLNETEDAAAIAAELMSRFHKREESEIARLAQVQGMVTANECLTNRLVSHFGERRIAPCGHCTHCVTGRAARLPSPQVAFAIPEAFDRASWNELRAKHPAALADPRQAARFLCGLTSPATSRLKLGKHPCFGALEEMPFAQVMAWCAK